MNIHYIVVYSPSAQCDKILRLSIRNKCIQLLEAIISMCILFICFECLCAYKFRKCVNNQKKTHRKMIFTSKVEQNKDRNMQ